MQLSDRALTIHMEYPEFYHQHHKKIDVIKNREKQTSCHPEKEQPMCVTAYIFHPSIP